MRKVGTILLINLSIFLHAQNNVEVNCLGDTINYFSVGNSNYGLGFGNPSSYTGVRLSMVDKNCETNGLSLNMFGDVNVRKTNGIDVGFSQSAGVVNGVSFGIMSNEVDQVANGLSYATVLSETYHLNGVGITAGFQRADVINGVTIAGIHLASYEIHGLAISGLSLKADSTISGIGLTAGMSKVEVIRGAVVAPLNRSEEVKGLQIGLINKTDFLKGVQIGLINYVSSNPKWCRITPGINLGFKVKPLDWVPEFDAPSIASKSCKNGTLTHNLKEEKDSVVVPAMDSITIVFDKSVNPEDFKLYHNERGIKAARAKTSEASDVIVKLKKSDTDLYKIISRDSKKCVDILWNEKYHVLKIVKPYEFEDTINLVFTNNK